TKLIDLSCLTSKIQSSWHGGCEMVSGRLWPPHSDCHKSCEAEISPCGSLRRGCRSTGCARQRGSRDSGRKALQLIDQDVRRGYPGIFSHPDSLLTSQLRASLCVAFRRSLRVKSCTSPLVNRAGGRLLSCRSCRFSCRIEWHA